MLSALSFFFFFFLTYQHARWIVHCNGIGRDNLINQLGRQIMTTGCHGSGPNLLHGRTDKIPDNIRGELQPTGIKISDGANTIQTGIVQQLPPAHPADIGIIFWKAFPIGAVNLDKLLGFALGESIIGLDKGLIFKRPNRYSVVVLVDDFARAVLMRAAEAHPGKDHVIGECGRDRVLDVESVLDEHDGRMALCDGG